MSSGLKKDGLQWFAARVIGPDAAIIKRLELDGIRYYSTRFARGIIFMHCTLGFTKEFLYNYWGKVFFYLDPERKNPQAVPDNEMCNFILVTSASNDLVSLGKVSEELLKGDRVRVTAGVFKGAEGVVKRIKGDRRLVISISGLTAVATCYISKDFLEKI